MGNKDLNIQHGGDIDLAIKKYGGQRADWIDLSTGINRTSYPWQEGVKVELRDLPSSKLLIGLEKAASKAYKVAEGNDTAAVQGHKRSQKALIPQLFRALNKLLASYLYA